MKALFILNDAPYGSERTYNALRLAGALVKSPDHTVRSPDASRGTLDGLREWTEWADQVLVY